MGKLTTTFLIIMSGLTLLFYFGGMLDNTPNALLLNLLLSPEDIQQSSAFAQVIILLELIAAAGIFVGSIFTNRVELVVTAGFVIFLANLLFDFVAVYQVVAQASQVLAILVFSPIFLAYTVTLVEFWRGND